MLLVEPGLLLLEVSEVMAGGVPTATVTICEAV